MSDQTNAPAAPEATPAAVPDMIITVEDSGAVRPGYDPRPDAVQEAQGEPQAAPEGEGGDDAPGGDKPASKPEAKPEDKPDGDLPLGVKKRLAREERRREDAERKLDEFDTKLQQAQRMIDALRERKEGKAKAGDLDPNDFDSYEDYSKAVAARKAGKDTADAPAPEDKPDPELSEARGDLMETVRAVDADLWDAAAAIPWEEAYFGRDVVLELADADDPVGVLRALVAMKPEERAEITGQSRRGIRRAFRDLAGKAAAAKPAPPERDPSTGQFRKQSEAPEPISPVSGSPVETSLEKLSPTDYIVRRNAEEAARNSPFGWS